MELKKKEITYRGKGIEELKEMGVREFAKYLPSDSRRAIFRQFEKIEKFLLKCKERLDKGKQIKTHLRELVIVPQMVGLNIGVYNGQTFIPVRITIEMLGHRLGEFSLTRGKVQHGAPGIGATKSSASMSVK